MLSWSFLYMLSEWVIRLIMLGVVTNRRRPNSAMAWLLVIFFLPWVGLVLYLLFGENRLPHRRIQLHDRLLDRLRLQRQRLEDHPSIVHPQPSPESLPAVRLAEKLGSMPIFGGNDIEIMSQSHDVISRLIDDIEAARHHVHLMFYIYAADETGRAVTDALARAVARGVKCRVLIDAVGSSPWLRELGMTMSRAGIEMFPMLPVNLFRRQVARIDLRNHRKLAIIDGQIAYTGSQNIIDISYGRKDLAWHDLTVRLRGPVVLQLQAVFLGDWYFESNSLLDGPDIFPEPEAAGAVPVQTLPSGPNYPTENYPRLLVAAIYSAQTRVIITTPYFVPDEGLMQAMQSAALRGVRVDLIVPRKSNQRMAAAASRAYYSDLLESGVRIFLYRPGLLHAKTMTVDNSITLIGSGNFDIRSFQLNFELNLLLYGSDVARRLRAEQQSYLDECERVDRERWERRSSVMKLVDNVAKLLSPLL